VFALASNPKTDLLERSSCIEVVDASQFRHATPRPRVASYRQTGQVLLQRPNTLGSHP
jgi:hypothetical protein